MKRLILFLLVCLVFVGSVFSVGYNAQISTFDTVAKTEYASAVSVEDAIGGTISVGETTDLESYAVSLRAQFSFSKTFNLHNATRFAGVPERWNGEVGAMFGLHFNQVGMELGPVASVSYFPNYSDYILQLGVVFEPSVLLGKGMLVSLPIKYLYHAGYTTLSAGINLGYVF